jgi:thiol-disulfide isomerase/thioredoxin
VTPSAPGSSVKPPVGWWRERRLRRASRLDLAVLGSLLLLAVAAVAAGRRAHLDLRPRSAIEVGGFLDELELPTRLPNAPVMDAAGNSSFLLSHIKAQRAAVAFYAPWCGPCQKELPKLNEKLGKHADVLVVVSADEDLDDTRRALANLELSSLGFLVDVTGQLHKEGRVKALPTTFLLTPTGAVVARTTGFSEMELFRLSRKVAPADPDSSP